MYINDAHPHIGASMAASIFFYLKPLSSHLPTGEDNLQALNREPPNSKKSYESPQPASKPTSPTNHPSNQIIEIQSLSLGPKRACAEIKPYSLAFGELVWWEYVKMLGRGPQWTCGHSATFRKRYKMHRYLTGGWLVDAAKGNDLFGHGSTLVGNAPTTRLTWI